MKTINTKGKVWPKPMEMVQSEVDRGETELDVLLDNPVSASNVMKFLELRGFGVQLRDDEGAITISARKRELTSKAATFNKQPAAPVQEALPLGLPLALPLAKPQATALYPRPALEPSSETFSVLITGHVPGNDRKLGDALMKSFLSALSQRQNPPLAVALVNKSIKLALYDSSSCEYLKILEKKGASVLICGTSANYFNITDQIGAGAISNIPEIIETLNRADKIMTLT